MHAFFSSLLLTCLKSLRLVICLKSMRLVKLCFQGTKRIRLPVILIVIVLVVGCLAVVGVVLSFYNILSSSSGQDTCSYHPCSNQGTCVNIPPSDYVTPSHRRTLVINKSKIRLQRSFRAHSHQLHLRSRFFPLMSLNLNSNT